MLSMLTTEEFAGWFRELPDAAAEEVATGLELIERLGPESNPPASSEFLLWYESSSGSARSDAFYHNHFVPALERVRHIMQHLESSEVRERLTRAPIERAQLASDALRKLRLGMRPALVHLRGASSLLRLEHDYRSILDALGLQEIAARPASSALRELSLRKREPGMRILYGVDVPQRRALVVLGDFTNRNAYGPSVRRALGQWQEFLAGGASQVLEGRGAR